MAAQNGTCYVKGECYANAFRLLNSMSDFEGDALLCHGNPRWEGKRARMGHAWVEVNDALVVEHIGCIPRDVYYKVGNITYVKRYTLEAARKMILARDTFGPWDRKIRRLLHKKD